MYRSDRHRWLPAVAVAAALVFAVPAFAVPAWFSESAAQTITQSGVQSATQAPAQSSTPAPVQAPLQTLAANPAQAPASAPSEAVAVATQPRPVAAVPSPSATPEELGDSMMAQQRFQAAIEAYKKAPRSADVWNKQGIAYQLMFNPESASRCYEASLKLNPKSGQVMNNLGTIYDSEKQYNNAERMYRKALKLDPKSALIYKNLGTNLLAQRKYKKGWEVYKTALELDPNIFRNSTSPRVQNPASSVERGAMNYYMAKGCVRAGMNDCAIDYLRMALNEGFTSPKKIEADSEFAGLKGLPAFEQLLASQRQQ
jgi:tetratricopeptide (TPR) repeat protein